MSTLSGRPVGMRRALGSNIFDLARAAYSLQPAGSDSPRNQAFAKYRRQVRRIMRGDTTTFRTVEKRLMARGSKSSIIEVVLRSEAAVDPGDMLYVWWHNDPADLPVIESTELLRYWTTPVPHRPARRARGSAAALAESVFDLGAPGEAATGAPAILDRRQLLARPRIVPRLYTVSGARHHGDGCEVRLHVTLRDDWPRRSSAFLHRLQPGQGFEAWIMPHPHRVDRTLPGLAVATGSGAAAAFAALRAGARDIDLVWGLGDKRLERWVAEELREHEDSGALASVELVYSPRRVTEVLRAIPDLTDRSLDRGWLYASGNSEAGRAVHELLLASAGEQRLSEASASLRYINSS